MLELAIRKKSPTRKPGLLIDVSRVISVGADHSAGQAVFRFRDERGRLVTVRRWPRQFRTLEEAAG